MMPMMTGRKRWWRAVALAAVGGGVIGGWFGLVRPQLAKANKGQGEETNWTRSTASTPAPSVAEVRAPESAPPTGPVVPASGTLPIPNCKDGSPVAPAVPVTPPLVLVPSAPLPVPAPGLPEVQPVAGPRVPDAGLISADRPAIPAVPSLPPAELPALPAPPKMPEAKPVAPVADMTPKLPVPVGFPPVPPSPAPAPAPVVPPAPLPMTTAEPPKAAPLPPPMPLASPGGVTMPPVSPVAPVTPIVPPGPAVPLPTDLTPAPSPVKPPAPVPPAHPAKPDSDLKLSNPANTLKPTAPLVAPATPIAPPATGREAPGTPVDRPKPADPNFGSTDKFVFPVPLKPATPNPTAPTPRDDTMSKLSTTAAFAVLGGAIFALEKANAFPTVPPPSAVIPAPGALVKADDKMDVEKLKTDLAAANRKIEDLEKQVKRLTDLLTGKREGGILVDPTAPGTVEDVKALKDRIADLEKELKALKTQTSLKPSVGAPPEGKPKGIVKVVNEYPVEISMVINEKSYRVAPNTKLDVEVPAGEFSYQLLQSGAAVTRSVIKDKETVTLRIK